jgi:hypothetical protein
MAVNYGKLVRLFEQRGVATARADIEHQFEIKELRPTDFDLGRLFVECFGYHEYARCRYDRDYLANSAIGRSLLEQQGAVTTAAFSNITGQIVYSAILEPYQFEEFVFTREIPEVNTNFLDGEKIAGITPIGDAVAIRAEAQPYVLAGPGENWIFTPPVLDRGAEVPVTWEAVFADRTGQLLERCRQIGWGGAANREKRAIDCILDLNTTAHRYNWRGTVIASYGDNSGTHSWDNLSASNPLTDWSNLNNAEQNLNALTDPFTGEPIDVMARHLIVAKSLQHVAERLLGAEKIRVATPGFATTGNPTQTEATNPYANRYTVLTNRWVAARISAGSGNATDWFLGDVGKYARYMVAEKLAVVPMPSNTIEEYRRRIVAGWRVNERGAYSVWEPRALNKSTA